MVYRPTVTRIPTTGGVMGKMRETIRLMGLAIKNASIYPPIRNNAAAVASTAPPKDFYGQLRALYDDFVRRWRYVKDPVSMELLTNSPEAIWRLTMGGDGAGVGRGYGAGDCDCASIALGAELESIGFPVRLGTTAAAHMPPGKLFGHVFVQANCPGHGWVTLDPVLHPVHPFGAIASHSRIAWWDLNGNILGYAGNVSGGLGGTDMLGASIDVWEDMGLGESDPNPKAEPIEWEELGLSDWGWLRQPNGSRISTVGVLGYIDGSALGGLMAEVDLENYGGRALSRTPMLELAIDDYDYMVKNRVPYEGMLALGDTGEVYAYDGLGGFFKKLFKKAKKAVRWVRKKVKKGITKVLKKSKFGRALLKIGGKIKAIAMKIVKPLMKFVGKYAAKLAPICAMIPGYGTAIAAALTVAGKISKTMSKWGVSTKGKPGTVRGLALKDPKKLPAFRKSLVAEAEKMKRFSIQNPQKFQRMLAEMKRKGAQ